MSSRGDADTVLIERYLRGDVDAFSELMRAHEDRVFAICLRMLRDREAALDATQETFITVFRKADRFAGHSAFSTWLYRVAVNTCYDQARRRGRQAADPLPEGMDRADDHAREAFEAAELRPDLEAALARLPAEFRAAVVICDAQGLPLQTAADILGVPIGTVKSRVFRGRRLLAEALGNLRTLPEHLSDEHHG
ncbi:MAG: sigma-70 family RNA polymerase sigma factor [Acidimicrobiia bacterium]|nr:sigma-70 family RNA polymerase sigma factor [Acidimicrobiia bacterium]